MHIGWQQFRAALRGARVAPGLLSRSLHPRLGPDARLVPTPRSVVDLLDGYLSNEARGQRAEGRFFVYREGERLSARKMVARMRALVPELGPITLAEETRGGRSRFVIRTTGAFIEVDSLDVDLEVLEGGWARRVVTVDALVVAVNKMLKFYGETIRFLPVASEDGVNAFLAVDEAGAEVLERVLFWDGPLEELEDFAQWQREGSGVYRRPDAPANSTPNADATAHVA